MPGPKVGLLEAANHLVREAEELLDWVETETHEQVVEITERSIRKNIHRADGILLVHDRIVTGKTTIRSYSYEMKRREC